jgi:hypothetical protein
VLAYGVGYLGVRVATGMFSYSDKPSLGSFGETAREPESSLWRRGGHDGGKVTAEKDA